MWWWLPIRYLIKFLITIFVVIGAIEILLLIVVVVVIDKIMQNDTNGN